LGGTASNLEAMKGQNSRCLVKAGLPGWGHSGTVLVSAPEFFAGYRRAFEKYNEKYPAHGKPILSPAGQYRGQEKAFQTLAFLEGEMLIRIYPKISFTISRAIHAKEGRWPKVDASWKDGGFVDFPNKPWKYCDVPLHPGAVKFYQELGLKIPDKLMPPK